MTENSSEVRCPRCGEATAGRFCSACGVPLRDVTCSGCGQAAAPGARFCADCGAGLTATADVSSTASRPQRITTLIGGAALLVLVAFVGGVAAGRRSTTGANVADQSGNASANVS